MPSMGHLGFCKEGEELENYTKDALKSWEALADLLEDKDNLFVVACNKCFKAFETVEEPECGKLVALAEGLDKNVTGVVKADFLCNQNHTGKLQLPEGTGMWWCCPAAWVCRLWLPCWISPSMQPAIPFIIPAITAWP